MLVYFAAISVAFIQGHSYYGKPEPKIYSAAGDCLYESIGKHFVLSWMVSVSQSIIIIIFFLLPFSYCLL